MPEKRQANTTSACPTETVTITPACLSELYGIPTTPAKEKSQTLLVTGYIGEFPQKDDLSVNDNCYYYVHNLIINVDVSIEISTQHRS